MQESWEVWGDCKLKKSNMEVKHELKRLGVIGEEAPLK
jgi:hypothetical protein